MNNKIEDILNQARVQSTENIELNDVILTFGKYKGIRISEIYVEDRQYLEWVMTKTKDDYLKRRISEYFQNSKKYIKEYLITGEGNISYEMYRYASSLFTRHLRDKGFFGKLKSNDEIDHKFSVMEGFQRNIKLSVLNNTNNLEILSKKKNASKGANCSISEKELKELDKCDEFLKFFTGEKIDEYCDLLETIKQKERHISELEAIIREKVDFISNFDIQNLQNAQRLLKQIEKQASEFIENKEKN